MAVYLGNAGSIELIRKSLQEEKLSVVNPDDVNVTRKRFSFDFDVGTFLTGDFITITSTDGVPLSFIGTDGWRDGNVHSSGNWYIFVDEIGGIRLYNTFNESLEGAKASAVTLTAITSNIAISVTVKDSTGKVLGSVSEYELNTNREAIDVTTLSDSYREQYSSLITGSGQLIAQWDYKNKEDQETVNYLMQLVLRTEIGGIFGAKFYIKSEDSTPISGTYDQAQINDSLWWEFDALITNSATNFSPDQIVLSTISFVTTGPVRLKARTTVVAKLLQEDGDFILLEQGGKLAIDENE
jgi:hypothetical protein